VDEATARKGLRSGDRVYVVGGSFWDAPWDVGRLPWNPEPSVGYFHYGFRVVLVGDLKGAGKGR
jgi:hypothetical protein